MKNLIPLKRKNAYWDDIVNKKRPVTARVPLRAIRPAVVNRFAVYSNHTIPNTLQTISASPFAAPNISILKSCYNNSNALSSLKKSIKNKQSILLRAECQYCNISEPNTFDHYLPQKYFSEFSALSINLIPCCSKCNTDKGEEWLLANGNRRIINLYYDILPTVQYLICTVTYHGTIPRIDYSINSVLIPIALRDTIVSHYDALNLTDRYKEKSNSEITDVLNSIAPWAGTFTRSQIQTHLVAEATRMKADRGANYWRAVLKIALSNSNGFLTYAGY